jgi:hypothetical protein
MGLFSAMARIASIPLVGLTGCTAQLHQTEPSPAPPQPPPTAAVATSTPSVVVPEPPPSSARMPLPQQRFNVPENTRDPILVERGVSEWLDRQPGYPVYQKIAVIQRMRQESGFDPCAANGPMRYLLQWRDGRLRRLYQATNSRPGACPSWLEQMHLWTRKSGAIAGMRSSCMPQITRSRISCLHRSIWVVRWDSFITDPTL